ncbi:MAG: VCBS repeat-containing protein [Bacteroidota bacterium]
MYRRVHLWLSGIITVLLFACTPNVPPPSPLFQRLDSQQTGVHFSNRIVPNDTMNILKFEYVYNGGGVAIADFNQDSLPDIFFTGNQVPNQLYLNKGDFTFEDVSDIAQIAAPDYWSYGVSTVDINADGKMDLYVATTIHKPGARRANQLFINQGNDEAGIPIFSEQAASFGIADTGHSVMGAFLDYDRDGDLDLYVLTNEMDPKRTPNSFRELQNQGQNPNTDRLYRNNGNNTFAEVSKEAGIRYEGYGLGVSIRDINLDDWPDIYVSNDYISNDILYINQQDGTFANEVGNYIKHQSHSAMGNDIADLNSDGMEEIVALDMLPELNERKKMLTPGNNYMSYVNTRRFGYEYQYVRNTLQVNNGPGPDGHPTFSEVSQYAGIQATDWSWSPLFADYDHDGDRDLLVTNGFPKDITDLDFGLYQQKNIRYMNARNLQRYIPEVKITNYAFENQGDFSFSNSTEEWGMQVPSFSNGAAFADLDLDGDLDYVVNNINDSAFVYENKLEERTEGKNYLILSLTGKGNNIQGLGTRISIHYGLGNSQYYTHSPYRGYISSVEPIAHFGLDSLKLIDSIQIFWPDGSYQILRDISANQHMTLYQKEAVVMPSKSWKKDALRWKNPSPVFSQISAKSGLIYKHEEQEKFDFNLQYTLPHKFTQSGPSIAVGDINNDGLDDVYIGGSTDFAPQAFIQKGNGTFSPFEIPGITISKEEEDMGMLFFDADGDEDQDLYVVSGSYEFPVGHSAFSDRLFFNDGTGEFQMRSEALPDIRSSGSCVRAADIDRDGDLDLFIGGRVVSGRYPEIPESFLLINEGGKFLDSTPEDLRHIGMVTDALFTDSDNDGWIDLLIAGEWMPLVLFTNNEGKLRKKRVPEFEERIGWWNSLQSGDFDSDGDMDYLAGNLGLNTAYRGNSSFPLQMIGKDFDNSGSVDPIIFCYLPNKQGETRLYPMHTRDDLTKQMQIIRKRFPLYEDFGNATFDDLLTQEERVDALSFEANFFSSSYIENLGSNRFSVHEMPKEAQYAPVNGMQVYDVNGDGNLDALLIGNDYGAEIFTGRYDAMEGLVLLGNGKGDFQVQLPGQSGFQVPGDAKALTWVYRPNNNPIFIATQNQDSLKVFSSNTTGFSSHVAYSFQANEYAADLYLPNDKIRRVEVPYGSSYLSQSSRTLLIPHDTQGLIVYSFEGKKRQVDLKDVSNPKQ